MLIAIASDDARHISGHLGMCRRFVIWEALPGQPAREIDRRELAPSQTLHAHATGDHALNGVDVLLTTSAGAPLVARLEAQGLTVRITHLSDPGAAVDLMLAGDLAGVAPCVAPAGDDQRERLRPGRAPAPGACGSACGHRR